MFKKEAPTRHPQLLHSFRAAPLGKLAELTPLRQTAAEGTPRGTMRWEFEVQIIQLRYIMINIRGTYY